MRLSDLVSAEQCYATRVWGFSPETWGAMGFPKPGAADKWLRREEPLRVVCFVSHNAADHIVESDRGLVLGVYELSPIRVDLEADDVLDVQHLRNRRCGTRMDVFDGQLGLGQQERGVSLRMCLKPDKPCLTRGAWVSMCRLTLSP